jgi:hypothetical protein
VVTEIKRYNITLVQGQRCRVWVQWFGYQLPEGVRFGQDIIAYGKLMTFGNARSFQIIDSVLIKGVSRLEISEALSKFLKEFIVAPPSRGKAKPNGHDLP